MFILCTVCIYSISILYILYLRCISFALDQTIGTSSPAPEYRDSAGSPPCLGVHLFPRLELTGQTEVNDLREDERSRHVKNPRQKKGEVPHGWHFDICDDSLGRTLYIFFEGGHEITPKPSNRVCQDLMVDSHFPDLKISKWPKLDLTWSSQTQVAV